MDKQNFQIEVLSFGYKYNQMPIANYIFDVRFLSNPYWDPKMRVMSGLDDAVVDYVWSVPGALESYQQFVQTIQTVLPYYVQKVESKNESIVFKIAFGCTGGQHRSVAFAKRLAAELSQLGYAVSINHRDLEKSLMEAKMNPTHGNEK